MPTLDELISTLNDHGWQHDGQGRYARQRCSIMVAGSRVFFSDGDPPSEADDTAASVGGTITVERAIAWVRSKGR